MPPRPPYSASASPADHRCHLQLRPSVHLLPDQRRRGDHGCDDAAQPQHRPPQKLPRAGHGDGDDQHRTQQYHLELGQRRDARYASEGDQQSVVAQPHPPDQQPDQQQPLGGLQRVRRQPVTGQRRPQRCRLRQRRHHLCASITSELARDQPGEHDCAAGGQRGGRRERQLRAGRDASINAASAGASGG